MYPSWICRECGIDFGRQPHGHLATFHQGQCGWCEKDDVAVTEPRDYGYPICPKK